MKKLFVFAFLFLVAALGCAQTPQYVTSNPPFNGPLSASTVQITNSLPGSFVKADGSGAAFIPSFSAANGFYFLGDSYGYGNGMPTPSYGLEGQVSKMTGSLQAPGPSAIPGNSLGDMTHNAFSMLGYTITNQNAPTTFVDCCVNNARLGYTAAQGEQDFFQTVYALIYELAVKSTNHISSRSSLWNVTAGTWVENAPIFDGAMAVAGSNYTVGDTICFNYNALCTMTATVTAVNSGGLGAFYVTAYPPQYNSALPVNYTVSCVHCQNGSATGAIFSSTDNGAGKGVYGMMTSGASSSMTAAVNVKNTGVLVLDYIAQETPPSGQTYILGGGSAQAFLDGSTTPLTDSVTGSTTISAVCGIIGLINAQSNCVYASVFTGITPGNHSLVIKTTASNALPFTIIDVVTPDGFRAAGADGPSLILSTTAPTLQGGSYNLTASQYSQFAQTAVQTVNKLGLTNVILADEAKWSTTEAGGTSTNPVALGFDMTVDWAAATPTASTGCAVDGSNNATVYGTNTYVVGDQVFLYGFTACSFLNGFDNTATTLQPFTITSATTTSFVASSPSFTHASTGGELTDSGNTQQMIGGSIASNSTPLHPAQSGYAKFAQVLVAASGTQAGKLLSSFITTTPPPYTTNAVPAFGYGSVAGILGTSTCPTLGTSSSIFLFCLQNDYRYPFMIDNDNSILAYFDGAGSLTLGGALKTEYIASSNPVGNGPLYINAASSAIAGNDIYNTQSLYQFGNVELSTVSIPLLGAVTTSSTGGTLLASTKYCALFTAVSGSGVESTPWPEACITTGAATNTNTVTYSIQKGSGSLYTSINVYCRTSGAELYCANFTAASGAGTWTDTGAITPSGNSAPTVALNSAIVFGQDGSFPMRNIPRAYPSWHIASSLSTTNTPYGPAYFSTRGGVVERYTVNVEGTATCTANPVVALYVCGTSITGCNGAAGTQIASITTAGVGVVVDSGVISAVIPVGNFYTTKLTTNTCSVQPVIDAGATVRAN